MSAITKGLMFILAIVLAAAIGVACHETWGAGGYLVSIPVSIIVGWGIRDIFETFFA